MTPDRRLDQLEPLIADVLQKVDRLIEGQGQVLEVSIRADQNAQVAARGIANLTVETQQGFSQTRQDVTQVNQNVSDLRTEINQRFDQLITLIEERLK